MICLILKIIITQTDKQNDTFYKSFDYVLLTPKSQKYVFPITSLIILKILACEFYVCRDCKIDQPWKLAKSVIVERLILLIQ